MIKDPFIWSSVRRKKIRNKNIIRGRVILILNHLMKRYDEKKRKEKKNKNVSNYKSKKHRTLNNYNNNHQPANRGNS